MQFSKLLHTYLHGLQEVQQAWVADIEQLFLLLLKSSVHQNSLHCYCGSLFITVKSSSYQMPSILLVLLRWFRHTLFSHRCLCVCVYVCVRVCSCLCMCAICEWVGRYVYVCAHVCRYMWLRMQVYILDVQVSVSVFLCVCTLHAHTCLCVCLYTACTYMLVCVSVHCMHIHVCVCICRCGCEYMCKWAQCMDVGVCISALAGQVLRDAEGGEDELARERRRRRRECRS